MGTTWSASVFWGAYILMGHMFRATLGDVFQFLAVKERVEFVVRRLMLCGGTNIRVLGNRLRHLLADPLRHLGGHR